VAVGPTGFIHAVARVASGVQGQLLATRLDIGNGVPAHYDVDVALLQGAIARLKVDATTGEISWRTPAIVVE
jgi:uncharacterized membrane protein YkoI